MDEDIVLSMRHVFFRRPTSTGFILQDISLDAHENDKIALLGPNGSGKTTLLNLVLGRLLPTSGSIETVNCTTGYVDQELLLFPWMSVRKNILFGLSRKGVSKERQEELLTALGSRIRIDDLLDKYPVRLSGGMRQRAVLARALVETPRFMLLDEPCSALDNVTKSEVNAILEELEGTCILITHDPAEAVRLSTRILLLCGGNEKPGRFMGEFVLDKNDAASRTRVENSVRSLLAHSTEEWVPGDMVSRAEREVRPGDNVILIAWDLRRANMGFDLICANLLRGVVYRLYLPNIPGEALQSFLDAVKRATGMPSELLMERLRIMVFVQFEMHATLDEYLVIEHNNSPVAGWQFPLPSNDEYVFALSSDGLQRVVRLLKASAGKSEVNDYESSRLHRQEGGVVVPDRQE